MDIGSASTFMTPLSFVIRQPKSSRVATPFATFVMVELYCFIIDIPIYLIVTRCN
jgi:hypothetical protein